MVRYWQMFRNADPKTKSFVLTTLYLLLLVLWSAIWPYVHLDVDRTQIPKKLNQSSNDHQSLIHS